MTLFYCTTDQIRVFVGVMPLLELRILKMYSFPHFSLTCMLWHIELKFWVLLCFTLLQIKLKCRQFAWELCPFWNLEYWKFTVFRTFLLHALTYWAEILHKTLFYFTSDQVWVSPIHVNFCKSNAPFWDLEYWNYTVFALFAYVLWHIDLKFYIWLSLMYYRSSSSAITLCPSGSPSIHFPHFPPTCIDKFSWNFKFDVGFFNSFLLEKYY